MRPGGREIRIRPDGDECVIRADGRPVRIPARPGVPTPEWAPLVPVRLGPKTITLDRWTLGSLPQPFQGELLPVGGPAAEAWSGVLSDGIELLRAHGTAGPVIEAVSTITPLRQAGPHPESATLADAFGCVLMSRPGDARSAALTLVHEVQHAKLTVLLDLLPLLEPTASERFYAPWRPDPRPLLGLLHGAYAHVGVVGFWKRQRDLESDSRKARQAEIEFARWARATTETLALLATRPELTEHGHEVVARMLETLDVWSREPVSTSARTEAERLRLAHRNKWGGR